MAREQAMKVFQYVAFYQPEEDSSDRPQIIVPIQSLLAKDEKQAALIAARAIPEEYVDRLDKVEIVVRPF